MDDTKGMKRVMFYLEMKSIAFSPSLTIMAPIQTTSSERANECEWCWCVGVRPCVHTTAWCNVHAANQLINSNSLKWNIVSKFETAPALSAADQCCCCSSYSLLATLYKPNCRADVQQQKSKNYTLTGYV